MRWCCVAAWKQRAVQWCKTGYKQVNQLLDRFSALIWRLLEIHIFKAVAFTVFLVCLEEVRRRSSLLTVVICVGLYNLALSVTLHVLAVAMCDATCVTACR